MVIVFCIEPVGTLTACTMKVIPKSAMMTVTTADSKYSRQMVLGGPCTLRAASGVFFSKPLPPERDGLSVYARLNLRLSYLHGNPVFVDHH